MTGLMKELFHSCSISPPFFSLESHLYFQLYFSSQWGPSLTTVYGKERGKLWKLSLTGFSGCIMAFGWGESLGTRRNCGRSLLPRRSVWERWCCALERNVSSSIKWPLLSGKEETGMLMIPTRSTMTAQIFVCRNCYFLHLSTKEAVSCVVWPRYLNFRS